MKKFFSFLLVIGVVSALNAQGSKIDSSKYLKLVTFTAQQDHDNMKQQLGITKLRPGQW